jgi:hypothetical protein
VQSHNPFLPNIFLQFLGWVVRFGLWQTLKLVTNIHAPSLIQWPFKQAWAMATHGILFKFLCIHFLHLLWVICKFAKWDAVLLDGMTLDTSSFQIVYKFHSFLNLGIAIVDVTNLKE